MDASPPTTANGALPDDIPGLRRVLAARDEMIARLMAEIARLKRWQYGRKSERMSELMAQLQLALGDLSIPQAFPAPAAERATVRPEDSTQTPADDPKVVPLRRKPRAFPAHLPREIVVHAPPCCNCPECGKEMRPLGGAINESCG